MGRPARLTGALLARKGQALPTGGFAHTRLGLASPLPEEAKCETKRSGAARPRAVLSSDLIRRSAVQPSRTSDRAGQDRIAFTVRLDRKRYTRLKFLAARDGRSGQEILIKALDDYFETGAPVCAGRRRRNR